jgi:hypothetical protein
MCNHVRGAFVRISVPTAHNFFYHMNSKFRESRILSVWVIYNSNKYLICFLTLILPLPPAPPPHTHQRRHMLLREVLDEKSGRGKMYIA